MGRGGTILLASVLAGSQADAAPQGGPRSLCAPSEVVVFSCHSRGKAVSVCRSTDLTPEAGFLQYRFGRPGKPLELEYPARDVHPSRAFVAWAEGAAKSSANYLKFTKGEHEYLVFMHKAAFDTNGGGVLVRRNGRTVGQLVCPRRDVEETLFDLGLFGIPTPKIGVLQHQEDASNALEAAGIRD